MSGGQRWPTRRNWSSKAAYAAASSVLTWTFPIAMSFSGLRLVYRFTTTWYYFFFKVKKKKKKWKQTNLPYILREKWWEKKKVYHPQHCDLYCMMVHSFIPTGALGFVGRPSSVMNSVCCILQRCSVAPRVDIVLRPWGGKTHTWDLDFYFSYSQTKQQQTFHFRYIVCCWIHTD